MAAMRGVLGRVGGAVQMFLQPENVRVVRMLWPLAPLPALAPLAHLANANLGQQDAPDSREGLFVLDAGRVPH